MRSIKLTVLSILLIFSTNLLAQSNSDFIIIDEIADDIEFLEEQYKDQPNVFFTEGTSQDALEQILISIVENKFEKLHIYVLTKPGAIIFNSLTVTSDNVDEYADVLKLLACKIKYSIVIHSDVVFTREQGVLLKQRLEKHTGLTVESLSD